MPKLKNRRVAILATDGFEQSELEKPRDALLSEGAQVHIVSPHSGEIRGWDENDWGRSVKVDKTLDAVSPDDYDALVLPGGQINPDLLRNDKSAVKFIKAIFEANKPIAAICHAPWLLAEAGIAKGRKLTSFPVRPPPRPCRSACLPAGQARRDRGGPRWRRRRRG